MLPDNAQAMPFAAVTSGPLSRSSELHDIAKTKTNENAAKAEERGRKADQGRIATAAFLEGFVTKCSEAGITDRRTVEHLLARAKQIL